MNRGILPVIFKIIDCRQSGPFLEVFENIISIHERKKLSYICSPTILSWQQFLNISLHISLFRPNWVKALSKTVMSGLSHVPSIFPNLVTIPFLQHNFLPRLLRYFLFFLLIRFLMILPTFLGFLITTQALMLKPKYSSSS